MHLFTPLKIREITLSSRIIFSPMCQYSSEDGFANDWHLGTRAVGGTAVVFTQAAARELLRHPYWPLEAAHELGAEISWPKRYLRARQ